MKGLRFPFERNRKRVPSFSSGKIEKRMKEALETVGIIILLFVIAGALILRKGHTPKTKQLKQKTSSLSSRADVDYESIVKDQELRIKELAANITDLASDLQRQFQTMTKIRRLVAEKQQELVNLRKVKNNQDNKIAALENNIVGSRKGLEKSEAAIKTLTAGYKTKLKVADQKATADLLAQKTSYGIKLITLRAERDKTIREFLASYAYLIEVKAKPNGVRWMESKIAQNKKGADKIKPLLNQKMDNGNYLSSRNWELFEQYSRTSKELKTLLNAQLKADYDHYKLLVEESRALSKKYIPR